MTTQRVSFKAGLFLLILVAVWTVSPVESYASWLRCFVDLDPEEVIMFNRVVPADRAKHQVTIEVQSTYSSSDHWLSSTDGEVIHLPAHTNTNTNTNNVDEDTPLMLKVRLRIPPELSMEDVQFVVEAQTRDIADAAAEAVEFVDRGVMCDGSRAFSRRHDEFVVLQIDTNMHPTLGKIDVTAGWATGMEAVTLTTTLTLQPVPPPKDEL